MGRRKSLVITLAMIISIAIFSVTKTFAAKQTDVLVNKSSFSPYVDNVGHITFPADFRVVMIHLGSWFVPEGDASGFHDVYTEPESALYYRKHQKFPDGATIIKELRKAETKDYTTGKNISHGSEDIKQWFVMIKDTKGRFKDNAMWGDGWGWALFTTNHKHKSTSSDYKKDCIACHIPAQKNDWIYIEGYPTLKNS